ncbi:unnamed protein product [Cercospora beticola]|nr:unnamed protein product [Cercospora beticola]
MQSLLHKALLGASGVLLSILVLFGLSSTPLASYSNLALLGGISGRPGTPSNRTLGFNKIFVIDLLATPELRDATALAAAVTSDGGLDAEYVYSGSSDSDSVGYVEDGKDDIVRGHLNALRTVVEQGLESALIVEAGMEWDGRIKTQMQELASATNDFLHSNQSTTNRSTSPYGDVKLWETLWLGHCGIANGAVVRATKLSTRSREESTVLHDTNQQPMSQGDKEERCPLAYGVTQQGARRFLLKLMQQGPDATTDAAIQTMCAGYADGPKDGCLVSEPPLFLRHGFSASQSGSRDNDWKWQQIA